MSVFDRPGLYLRNPQGGVEDVATMKASGFAWIAINVGDHTPEEWSVVQRVADAVGVVVLPWARCTTDARVAELCDLARSRYSGRVIVNAEKELDTGAMTPDAIVTATEGMDAALSTEPLIFATLGGSPLLEKLVVQLQLFPQENETSKNPRECRAHAFRLGAKVVHFMLGVHDPAPPEPPLDPKSLPPPQAPYSVYTADDCGNVFKPWRPRRPKPLDIPFTGPLFGPSHQNGPSPECGTVQALMVAMDQAGFGSFPNPDGVFSEALEAALANFQRNFGLTASGQYGKASYERVRRLLAVAPGGGHALTTSARALIADDAPPA